MIETKFGPATIIAEENSIVSISGCKESQFYSLLKLVFISPNVISSSPKHILIKRIDFTVLL